MRTHHRPPRYAAQHRLDLQFRYQTHDGRRPAPRPRARPAGSGRQRCQGCCQEVEVARGCRLGPSSKAKLARRQLGLSRNCDRANAGRLPVGDNGHKPGKLRSAALALRITDASSASGLLAPSDIGSTARRPDLLRAGPHRRRRLDWSSPSSTTIGAGTLTPMGCWHSLSA